MSFTEFSYQILQAWDFLQLYKRHNCSVQIGGSDQWGNIVAGVDLVRRLEGAEVHGVTLPLLTTPSGQKIGKSEGNAVWLDATMSSHFVMYQYLLNMDDATACDLLGRLTLLPTSECAAIVSEHGTDPAKRLAQRRLAQEVLDIARGPEAVTTAEAITWSLFPTTATATATATASAEGEVASFRASLDGPQITRVAADLVRAAEDQHVSAAWVPLRALVGADVAALAVDAGVCESRSDARRMIKAGALRCGDRVVSATRPRVEASDLFYAPEEAASTIPPSGALAILRAGRKRPFLAIESAGATPLSS